MTFNAMKSKYLSTTTNRSLALPTFEINGGNSIEIVDEWVLFGHLTNINFFDDTEIIFCRNKLIGQINRFLCFFTKLGSVIKNS
jgi:hypothetical protein